jgi:hypothetical protein
MVYLAKLKEGDPMVVLSSLSCALYRAIDERQKAVLVNTPLFDLEATTERLRNYPLSVFEQCVEYVRTAFFYGKGQKILDFTDKVPSKIPVQYDLSLIAGNPSNKHNDIFLAYTLNGVEFTETYSEPLNTTIYTDLTQLVPRSEFFWLDTAKLELMDSVLKSIRWKETGTCPKGANLLHALSPSETDRYPRLLEKYKEILDTHVPSTEPLVVISRECVDLESFLKERGYHYTVLSPLEPVTFSVAIQCTGSFVGNFEMEKLTGSFTSYYLHVVSACKQSILVDLDNLR